MSTPAKVPELRANVLNRTVYRIKRRHNVKWYKNCQKLPRVVWVRSIRGVRMYRILVEGSTEICDSHIQP